MKTKSKKQKPVTKPQLDIRPNDYIIGNDGKKRWLMQVNHVDGDQITGVLDHNRAYSPVNAEFTKKQVIAVLGPNPEHGSVFGVRVEPYRRTLEHPDWGNVHWFVDMSKEDKLVLRQSLTQMANKLKKHKLFDFVAEGNLEIEIKAPRGKYTGMYYCVTKKEAAADRMELRPKPGIPNDYVIAHESGHGVWFRLMSAKQQARWIKFYKNFCKAIDHDPKLIAQMREDFIKDEIPVKDFRSQLDEQQTITFDLILSNIRSNHRLTARHIDQLIQEGYAEEFRDMWPKTLDDTDFEIAVSEYGTRSPEELFAEAFAFWMTGHKLPKSVQKLLDKTIQGIVK